MNIKNEYAEKALKLTTLLTLLVAGYEVARACGSYKAGMNFLDIASFATADLNTYCIVLILANLILLPSAVLLYKQSGISLKDEIFDKKTLFRDICFGLVLAGVSAAISLLSLLVMKGRTDLAFPGWNKLSVSEIILMAISLGLVSGFCKEIFFRGFAKNYCGPVLGEMTAFILFDVMFGLLDWHNMGHSFIVGLLWIWGYRKSKHLIVPMIAHGGMNLISVLFFLFTT